MASFYVFVGVGFAHNISRRCSNGVRRSTISTPNDHLTAGPDRRVRIRCIGCVDLLVAVQLSVLGSYLPPVFLRPRAAPDDHFTAGPDCGVIASGSGRVGSAGGCPTVRARIISPAGVRVCPVADLSTPDDHLTAGPDCRVKDSVDGRVGGAGRCPTIGAGIVSPASVSGTPHAPDDHFTAGPDCGVNVSGRGRVGGAGRCPTIGAGIVSPASVGIGADIRPR